MFIEITIRDIYKKGLPAPMQAIFINHIVRIIDDSDGPIIELTRGEQLRTTMSYASLLSLINSKR